MIAAIDGFDELAEVFPTTGQRVLVTAAMVAVFVVVLLSTPRLQQGLHDRTSQLARDVVTAVVVIGTFVFTVAVGLGVWGQASAIVDAYHELAFAEEIAPNLALSVVVILGTYILIRFIRRGLEDVLGPARAVTEHQQEVAHRLTQVLFWTAGLIVLLAVWNVDLSGLLIAGGFLGIVLGMAARQTLGAIIAGFVLMFSKPFEVGDWVFIEGGEGAAEGIVTDISIVNTRVRSFDGEYVMVPNDLVTAEMVRNRSRLGRLRVEVDVGVDYDADVREASELARAAVAALDVSLSVPEPRVVTKRFDDSSIVLGVRFWIDKPSARRFNQSRTAAVEAIKSAFDAGDVKIPFPQREVSDRGYSLAHRDGSDEAGSVDAVGQAEQVDDP